MHMISTTRVAPYIYIHIVLDQDSMEIERSSSFQAIYLKLKCIVTLFGTRCLKASSLLYTSYLQSRLQISSPKDWVDFLMTFFCNKLNFLDIYAPTCEDCAKACKPNEPIQARYVSLSL